MQTFIMSEANRRGFLKKVGTFSATAFFTSIAKPMWARNLESALRDAEGVSPDDLADEEDFWYYVQQSFTVSPYLINLNNGGVSPAPKVVQEAMKRYYDFMSPDSKSINAPNNWAKAIRIIDAADHKIDSCGYNDG